MPSMQHKLHPAFTSECAQTNSHRREAIRVLSVQYNLQTVRSSKTPREKPCLQQTIDNSVINVEQLSSCTDKLCNYIQQQEDNSNIIQHREGDSDNSSQQLGVTDLSYDQRVSHIYSDNRVISPSQWFVEVAELSLLDYCPSKKIWYSFNRHHHRIPEQLPSWPPY